MLSGGPIRCNVSFTSDFASLNENGWAKVIHCHALEKVYCSCELACKTVFMDFIFANFSSLSVFSVTVSLIFA